ncbi:hypothetical protein P7C71_g405, partial [Lecanoromycetidae sp. Uapishka_2]
MTHTTSQRYFSWFAKKMGLPISRLVIGTNSNNILHRFMDNGTYSKEPIYGPKAEGGIAEDGAKAHPSGVKETLAPAMDILLSSNFERLLAYLAIHIYAGSDPSTQEKLNIMNVKVTRWLKDLKTNGGFTVDKEILEAARKDFSSECIDDEEIISTIRSTYKSSFPTVELTDGTTGKGGNYILDPHSAVGVAASLRHIHKAKTSPNVIALATAHPAKFQNAVDLALRGAEGYSFEAVEPAQFKEFKNMPQRKKEIGGEDVIGEMKKLMDEKILGR